MGNVIDDHIEVLRGLADGKSDEFALSLQPIIDTLINIRSFAGWAVAEQLAADLVKNVEIRSPQRAVAESLQASLQNVVKGILAED